MQKVRLFFYAISLCLATQVFASKDCFLVKDHNHIIRVEGAIHERYSPCSTFKIPLALMGFDSGILKDEKHPEWPFRKEYKALLESWKQPQSPTSWIKNSCVWYSQVLTPKLGMKKFQDYVQAFHYGNQDVSGDKGLNNGLTHAWLSSSLEIAPDEQALFLDRLLSNQLPVSNHANQMTKNILYVEDLPKGWKLYGKTGSGYLWNKDKTKKLEIQHGWFIGWIQKNERKIIFVNHIVDESKQKEYAGLRAKNQTSEKLLSLINQMKSA